MSLIEEPKILTEKELIRILKKKGRIVNKLAKVTNDPKKSEEFKKQAVEKGNKEWKDFLKRVAFEDDDRDEFFYENGILYCRGDLHPEPIIYD